MQGFITHKIIFIHFIGRTMIKNRIIQCSLFLILGLSASSGLASESFPMDDQHRGVLWLKKYQIYPENRFGNSLYLNKQLIAFDPGHMILEVFDVDGTESMVYLYKDTKDNLAIGLYDDSKKKQAQIKRVDEEFYEFWEREKHIRKIFRIYKGRLTNVLTKSRTGTGITPSISHVAFYHIKASERVVDEDGKNKRIYSFRIHILKRSEPHPWSLRNLEVKDWYPFLKLSWLNEYTLQYPLSSGEIKTVDLREHLPQHF